MAAKPRIPRIPTLLVLVAIDASVVGVLLFPMGASLLWEMPALPTVAFWVAISFVAALSQTELPIGGALTDVGDVVDIAGIAIVGPYPVLLANILVLSYLTLVRTEEDRFLRLVVNAAARLLSILLAAYVFELLKPVDLGSLTFDLCLAVVAVTLVYGVILTSHVSFAVAVTRGTPFLLVLRRNYLLPEITSLLLVPIPIAALLLWGEHGIWGVLLMLLPVVTAAYGLRAVFERGQLAERVERERHLTQLGTSAASILHEVQKPLSRILAEADLASVEEPQVAERFERLRDWAREAGDLANELLLALSGQIVPERFDLEAFIREIVDEFSPDDGRDLTLSLALPQELLVTWDMRGIRLVLENLLINAFEAGGEEPVSLTVHLRGAGMMRPSRAGKRAQEVIIEVSDNGQGLPQTEEGQMFEPLFTTKPSGTGLGLFLSNQLIKAHGGELRATLNRHGGSVFTVELPVEVASTPDPV